MPSGDSYFVIHRESTTNQSQRVVEGAGEGRTTTVLVKESAFPIVIESIYLCVSQNIETHPRFNPIPSSHFLKGTVAKSSSSRAIKHRVEVANVCIKKAFR
jgi:hypothetical protein